MDYTKDIKSILGEAGGFLPDIYYREEVDSTNEWIKRLAFGGAPEGITVCADAQTAGKGRNGRVWVSPAGENIYFSILLRPSFPPGKAAGLTLVMGLSVTEALRNLGLPVGIKWPNDVVAGGKKICGILTELMMEPGGTYYVVAGTGINVNQTAFAEEIKGRATSVCLAFREMRTAPGGMSFANSDLALGGMRKTSGGLPPVSGSPALGEMKSAPGAPPLVDRSVVLAEALKRFGENYGKYRERGDLSLVLDAYNDLLVNRGRRVRIEDPKGPYLAVARGIDASGALLVEREDGRAEAVSSGEVSVRGIYGYV